MLDREVFFPVVCQGLVKLAVLLLRNVVRVASPDGLGLVQLLVFGVLLLRDKNSISVWKLHTEQLSARK